MYANLRTIVPQQVMDESNHRPPPGDRLQIDLLVHKPDYQFKKSNPGPADFCVCVCDFNDEVPQLAELEELTLAARPRALKFAVIDMGTVTFYDLLDLKLTVYADYRGVEMVKPKKKNNPNKRKNNNSDGGNSGDQQDSKRSRLKNGAAAGSEASPLSDDVAQFQGW